jgi:hypothetical protein
MTSDCLPHQVTINKPELSARWGITLESKPQIGGAPKAPTITKLADGGLAIASGKIKVTHLLIAVNGTIVKGHEDGTLIATDDRPLHASAHRSAPAWQVRRCSRMLSATPS